MSNLCLHMLRFVPSTVNCCQPAKTLGLGSGAVGPLRPWASGNLVAADGRWDIHHSDSQVSVSSVPSFCLYILLLQKHAVESGVSRDNTWAPFHPHKLEEFDGRFWRKIKLRGGPPGHMVPEVFSSKSPTTRFNTKGRIESGDRGSSTCDLWMPSSTSLCSFGDVPLCARVKPDWFKAPINFFPLESLRAAPTLNTLRLTSFQMHYDWANSLPLQLPS